MIGCRSSVKILVPTLVELGNRYDDHVDAVIRCLLSRNEDLRGRLQRDSEVNVDEIGGREKIIRFAGTTL